MRCVDIMRTRVYSPVVYADIVIANQLRIHVIPIRIIGVYFKHS